MQQGKNFNLVTMMMERRDSTKHDKNEWKPFCGFLRTDVILKAFMSTFFLLRFIIIG